MTRPPLKPLKRQHGTRWSPYQLRRVREAIRQGYPVPELSATWGIPCNVLVKTIRRHALDMLPIGYMRVSDLAEEFGVQSESVRTRMRRRGMPYMLWMREAIMTEADAALLRAEAVETVLACPPGYVTATMLAEQWGLTRGRVAKILDQAGAPYLHLHNPERRNAPQRVYNAWHVRHLRPERRAPAPVGALTTQELAVYVGRGVGQVRVWASQGAPRLAQRGPDRGMLFRPAEFVAWLCQHKDSRTRRLGNYLARQERAA